MPGYTGEVGCPYQDFAKFANQFTFDIGNYYKVNQAFQFETSTAELNKYIEETKKR